MEFSVNPAETCDHSENTSGGEDTPDAASRGDGIAVQDLASSSSGTSKLPGESHHCQTVSSGILRSIRQAVEKRGDREPAHIVWFPHAGAGAASLVRPSREAPEWMNVHAVQLPGREDRFNEPAVKSLMEAAQEAADGISGLSGTIVLAGHSLGGLLAYRVAMELTQQGNPPVGLIVMAMSSPDRLAADQSLSHLDDSAFVEKLDLRYGGIPESVRDNQEALRIFLPVVRNDLALLDGYRYEAQSPLPFPVCALSGSGDRAADRIAMSGWRKVTSAGFTLRVFSGNHFFPLQHFGRVLEMAERMC